VRLCCRKCRDIPFALLFAAFWGGVISIAGVAFHQGNPAVLLYGLDYDGHVCGKNQPGANLLPYKAQYWVNPNEVIQANGYGFSLSDAKSICLKDCPQLLPNNQLSWVCAYPQDVNASAWASPGTAPSSLAAWAGAQYNYFTSLAPAAQATSCALQGPCYPVLTSQANVWHTCQTQTMKNLPVNPTAVALLQQCFSCCNIAGAAGTAACNATVRENCAGRVRMPCGS
jgi:choline transporter-like protein 2/4/5